jgi:2-polyprenyl-6-methoxyphenol hydroxylase-like FAD-dependent oxidoreductase
VRESCTFSKTLWKRGNPSTDSLGFIPCFIPQPAVLAMLTEESRKCPFFQLRMGAAFRDLIQAEDRVVGVRADGPDGPHDFPADLVVGTVIRPSASGGPSRS